MSKSLKRVTSALAAADLPAPVECPVQTRTAEEAAAAHGVETDQIGKSMVMKGAESGRAVMFLTAGGRQVDMKTAAALAGEPLERADAALVRASTGFAIGGVSPMGHVSQVPIWMDRRLLDFDLIWCAAGTPRHNFPSDPRTLAKVAGAEIADFSVRPE